MISKMKKQMILQKNSIVTYLFFFEEYANDLESTNVILDEAIKRNRIFKQLLQIAYEPEIRKTFHTHPLEIVHKNSNFYDKLYESSTIEAQWKRIQMALFDEKLTFEKRKTILETVLYSVSNWEVKFLYDVFNSNVPFIERETYATLRL